ncbi:MarR family transcriptional regulator [Pseudovibrio sp. Tun.PSC04-5.I4]|uniref:MarR family winged helix-turn-helix transcriptional regulator n=1 Tax=Pseudovibrio sp. Tun.PSC04-5.I4 TaxID=1798213 RepID=UPI000883C6AF|nr:MarR family transcriptional regulator [Pseudovibrio sp. Tun.PSC04-5.I4]SDQ97497.1 DNA-binding transcriptional regulator, MarR family [Pseudovibrio sp. Tun.PSC04-5.I4]
MEADPKKFKYSEKTPGFVDGYLLYLLASASHLASGQFHEEIRDADVRVPEWRVLACLLDNDGQMVTQLAHFALMEQSHLTKTIDQMADRGLVLRKTDEIDRRRVRIYLSDKGRELSDRLVTQARDHEARLIKQLKAGDVSRVKRFLSHMIETLEK